VISLKTLPTYLQKFEVVLSPAVGYTCYLDITPTPLFDDEDCGI
jgi:hypothetical protein